MFKYLFIPILVLFTAFQSMACDCIEEYIDNFCEATDEFDIIALVTITGEIDFAHKRIQVLEELNLFLALDEAIMVGQDGLNCGQELGYFEIGDTLILGLSHQVDSLFYLDGCHLFYLRYENGFVKGDITPEIKQTSYTDFKQDVVGCSLISNQKSSEIIECNILPNPAATNINIQADSDILDIALYAINGESIMHRSKINSQQIDLDISLLSAGQYYAKIRTKEGEIIKRIIKF